jgi:hypothetical protein
VPITGTMLVGVVRRLFQERCLECGRPCAHGVPLCDDCEAADLPADAAGRQWLAAYHAQSRDGRNESSR